MPRCQNMIARAAEAEARRAGLRVIETQVGDALTYVVIRILPNGRSTRVGARKDPAALRSLVARLTATTPARTH